MTLRLFAAFAFIMGAAILITYLTVLGVAPWASAKTRHLRAMKERSTTPRAYERMTIPEMQALPRHAPLAYYSKLERRGVYIEGKVIKMLRAFDGDFHLDLAAPSGEPLPYAVTEVTEAFSRGSATWNYEGISVALRPNEGTTAPWEGGPRRVRLSGWLMYDYQHEGTIHSDRPPPILTAWEIHPVTRIELWSDSLGRFVEYAR